MLPTEPCSMTLSPVCTSCGVMVFTVACMSSSESSQRSPVRREFVRKLCAMDSGGGSEATSAKPVVVPEATACVAAALAAAGGGAAAALAAGRPHRGAGREQVRGLPTGHPGCLGQRRLAEARLGPVSALAGLGRGAAAQRAVAEDRGHLGDAQRGMDAAHLRPLADAEPVRLHAEGARGDPALEGLDGDAVVPRGLRAGLL
mmetsp:Transcript_19335/g.60786  ORF Transcript_19335/g.60786 Transcript_19335/m.60786 type:complete len:202 (-) Transcript_19335:352-957(-)